MESFQRLASFGFRKMLEDFKEVDLVERPPIPEIVEKGLSELATFGPVGSGCEFDGRRQAVDS